MPIASTSSVLYPSPRVTIIGAGKVGSTLAQQIGEKNLADVVLLDEVAGLPQGLALDLMEAKGISLHSREFMGTTNYADTSGSDVVVIAAGQARKPGMSREQLVKVNAKIVVETATKAIAYSPNAILIVVTNPLDVMAYLAWQATELPCQRVLGMAGVLDAARFQAFIAMELGVCVADVKAMVLGSHGELMIPLPRYSTVNGIPITELIDTATIEYLVNRTRNGGAEIVELMQIGSAYFAPAAATCLMIEAILLNQSRLLPVAACLQGEYGLHDVFIGVPSRLGRKGIESILELRLTPTEISALHSAAQSVQQNIQQAQSFL